MAFRATRKASTTKAIPEPTKPEEAASPASPRPEPASAMSVEDLVGAPKENEQESKKAEEVAGASTPLSNPMNTVPIVSLPRTYSRSSYRRSPMSGPRPRSDGNRYQASSPRYSSGSPRFGGDASGYQTSGPYRRDYSSQPPPRRYPYSPRNGNGSDSTFSQDIDVPTETVKGMLDIMPEGHGFLRPKFTPSERDVYISQSQIRRFLLRNGDVVAGQARPPKENERFWGLLKVEQVNELPAEQMEKRPKFEDLVPIYPNKLLRLETGQMPTGGPLSTRMIDLVAPIGFGQRGLIVSPPKAGKTTILKELAAGIAANYPDVHLMAALIGERPEEVTDITRSVKGEVLASNFDESPAEQTRIAEVALDRAKRLVEMGRDVVILLDSITRLARAYNLVVNPSGRTLSGGFDPAALYPAKRFLGAARCVELQADGIIPNVDIKRVTTGGSLTVIGTALTDTGSRMDDLIYEEFKGTGNMELTLSRTLQERRVFPAIDVARSGTRHDELLLGEEIMKKVATLRHMLSLLSEEERTMMLIDRLGKTKTNEEFLDSLAKG